MLIPVYDRCFTYFITTRADMDIKDIVKDNTVHFARYRQGYAYYTVHVATDAADYTFPVPLDDIGDATLLATDKAMVFMRYIRKALADGTFVKTA